MPATNRRSFLRAGAALPLVALPALPALAAPRSLPALSALATLTAPPLSQAQADRHGPAPDAAANALRAGGVVIAFRHALAPGTFDPPGFTLGQCSTQRNLNDEGRAQARRIGAWFQRQGLTPAVVRSSPWCRCTETARLAFGSSQAWPALGSPRGHAEQTNAEHLGLLREALADSARQHGRFEVWVTHMFVLAALVQESASSGEGLVLRADGRGGVQVMARLAPA